MIIFRTKSHCYKYNNNNKKRKEINYLEYLATPMGSRAGYELTTTR